ncbi:MAG TPA: hypothetical protein VJ826_05805, partial [Candidatus Polarisedimenticolaceae bacterium]|nr:hypothetical protein [Candidatus Polarisedimenticolaceae bacterium]
VIALSAKPARRLFVEPEDVHWDVGATTSDVVWGDLRTLRQNAGAFDVATWACAADSNGAGWAAFANGPAPGEGMWFLERGTGDVYADEDASQVGSPDPGIAAAPGACP